MKIKIIFFLSVISLTAFSHSISLNGTWSFIQDSSAVFTLNSLPETGWRKTNIPSSWQSQFSDLHDYQGVGWYRREFKSPLFSNSENVLLKFEAVDYKADVYLNGKLITTHKGGYTPFAIDITRYLSKDNNVLIIRVLDPPYNEQGMEGISYLHIPHGKQSWYVQTSGIWRDVELAVKPAVYIENLNVTSSINGEVNLKLRINAKTNKKISFSIADPSGNVILKDKISVNGDSAVWKGILPSHEMWSPDSPKLYSITAVLGNDTMSEKFGFRKIEIRDGRIFLNNSPIFITGALDQDFYTQSIYTTPSEDYIRMEMLKAKQLGLNLLRCHIKIPDKRYMKIADELGILIWYEIPNWETFTKEAADEGSKLLDEAIERDWNHPSLVIVSIINESWGIDLSKAEQRKWLSDEYQRLKTKLVGRLVVDNSACFGNFHVQTDINDYHTYYAIPENRDSFDKTIQETASRPDWLFSSYGDSKQTHNEALMISEFGNWGLPKLPHELPWWFNRQFYEVTVSLPGGYDERFRNFGYDKIFGNYSHLAEESQHSQFNSLKYEIESIRLNSAYSGYIITEFTDINWESNGLLDMWRNFKYNPQEISDIQQQDVIIPRPDKYNYYAEDTVTIKVHFSHFSNIEIKGSILRASLSGKILSETDIPVIHRADVKELVELRFLASALMKSGKVKIQFEIIKTNKTIAKNFSEIFIYPSLNNSDDTSVIVTNVLTDEILNKVSSGETIICVVDSMTKIPEQFPFKIKSRKDEWYDGNWASNLNWIKKEHPLFEGISFGTTPGFSIAHCNPQYVITDIPSGYFDDALSGMFIGWIHLNSAYIFQAKYGNGKILFCTFPLDENIKDPFAAHLKNNLLRFAHSNAFNPKLVIDK